MIRPGVFKRRGNKYGAVKVTFDGINFDSKLEHGRYCELKALQAAKLITDLQVHRRFDLHAGGLTLRHKIGQYEADFCYQCDTGFVVEDCKGVITPLSAWKIKHMKAEYGIEVKLIRRGPAKRVRKNWQ